MTAARVVVGVPTYRRPDELETLIPLLLAQAADLPGSRVEVLVVDNDPAGSAEPVVTALGDSRVIYARQPTPGIAAVRNRILDVATADLDADLIAMIDDDERPESGWLAALVETQERTGATLVAGVVAPEFTGPLDPWVAAGRFHTRWHTQRNLVTGSPISVAPAGNLLLDARQLLVLGQRFDEGVGLSGGEDTLFSRSLHAKGATLVWCAESVAIDRVPLERMTRRWVLARAMSHGDATVRVKLSLSPGQLRGFVLRIRCLFDGVARIVGGAGQTILGVATRQSVHEARGLRTLMRGVGMVRGAWGLHHVEYARSEPDVAA